jgi:hypothetical protein
MGDVTSGQSINHGDNKVTGHSVWDPMQALNPLLARNVKLDHGFNHERTGALLCPIDFDWANHEYVVLLSLLYVRVGDTYLCSIKMKLKSGEIAVSRDQWPIFLYAGYNYNLEDPWNGLLQSHILICVCWSNSSFQPAIDAQQAFKHAFISPSSVE